MLSKALSRSFRPALDTGEFEELVEALSHNASTATQVAEAEKKIDKLLCIKCGPNRAKLRQLKKAGLSTARASA